MIFNCKTDSSVPSVLLNVYILNQYCFSVNRNFFKMNN